MYSGNRCMIPYTSSLRTHVGRTLYEGFCSTKISLDMWLHHHRPTPGVLWSPFLHLGAAVSALRGGAFPRCHLGILLLGTWKMAFLRALVDVVDVCVLSVEGELSGCEIDMSSCSPRSPLDSRGSHGSLGEPCIDFFFRPCGFQKPSNYSTVLSFLVQLLPFSRVLVI